MSPEVQPSNFQQPLALFYRGLKQTRTSPPLAVFSVRVFILVRLKYQEVGFYGVVVF